MHAATLRRRQDKLADSQGSSSASSASSSSARPPAASAAMTQSRLRVVASAVVIFAVFLVLRTTRKPKANVMDMGGWGAQAMEETYALCAKAGREGVVWTAFEGDGTKDECLVVQGKEVIYTGSLVDVRARFGDEDTLGPPLSTFKDGVQVPMEVVKSGIKVRFLPQGASITPGLVDSHGHVVEYGYWKSSADLVGATSIDEIRTRLTLYLVDQAERGVGGGDEKWIEGMGWDQNIWDVKEFPTAADLAIVPLLKRRPIVLTRIDGHAVWVSNTVLKLLEPLPQSVPGGEIVRDGNGNPTGIFMDNAMELIDAVKPAWTEKDLAKFLKKTVGDAVSKGLVSVHDASTPLDQIDFFERVAKMNLPLRIYSMIGCPDRSVFCGNDRAQIPWAQYDGRLVLQSVKLVADGALGSWGAAMHRPYSDRADGWKGIMLSPEEVFPPLVREWVQAGWQVNVHAIGDRANTAVLDAFASVKPGSARRPRLEHAQILTSRDLRRVVDLDVIASFQPTHATSDMAYAEKKIGPTRIKGAYAWQTILKNGGKITLGSDFPIESIDPLEGFYAAVTRLDKKGDSPHGPGGWFPDERLTRAQALKGMTQDAAYASFSENITGSLVAGKRADYVVWDRDLMSCPVEDILQAKVLMTVIDGQPVFGGL